MIGEIILSVSILLLCVTLAVSQYLSAKERKDMIRAIISKNLTEINTAESIDKMPKENKEIVPDEILVTADTPDLFDKMIKNQLKQS